MNKEAMVRIGTLRNKLARYWVGLESITDWTLASLIARENVLLLGPPGVAKTEIAETIFKSLGLEIPTVGKVLPALPEEGAAIEKWWEEREEVERGKQKYFRYLLSRFTQPEELFGPIEINLLRRGMLVHINFGLLTSPGVRAAFLDEIFKASSSILNSLLTLVLEREYFNWGGMRKSNLVMLIGASNELPGSLAAAGGGSEDFNLLHAFLDRFPLRLDVPNPSPHAPAGKHAEDSNLAEATRYALRRERDRFNDSQHPGKERATVATVDDVLAAGRDIMDVALGDDGTPLFAGDLRKFKREFFRIATSLWQSDRSGEPTWTLSPRKLKALYKIALAHAYVTGSPDDAAVGKKAIAGPGSRDLHVFDFIADSALHRNILQDRVSTMIKPEAS